MTRAAPTFLERGGAFVVAQGVLLAMIGISGTRSRRRGSRVGLGLMLAGATLGGLGGRTLGRNLTPLPEPVPGGQLVTEGVYASVRHPLYSALLLVSLGWSVWRGSGPALGWTAMLGVLLHFKSEREEAALLERYPEYAAYRRRVGRFVPGVG